MCFQERTVGTNFKMIFTVLFLSIVYHCSTEPITLDLWRTETPPITLPPFVPATIKNVASTDLDKGLTTKITNVTTVTPSFELYTNMDGSTNFNNDYEFANLAATAETTNTTPVDVFSNNGLSGTQSAHLFNSNQILILASVVHGMRQVTSI